MEKAIVLTSFACKKEGKLIPAGVLSSLLEDVSKELVREKFNKMKMEIVEKLIRFYMGKEENIVIACDSTGKWEDYERPVKGTIRLYPQQIRLVFEDEVRSNKSEQE